MKHETATLTSDSTVMQVLAKGVCPICTLVRAFQNELIERLQPEGISAICNFHAWAIAASAPALSAGKIFMEMLHRNGSKPEEPGGGSSCDICALIRGHESERVQEFRKEMRRKMFVEWLQHYGTICRIHGVKLCTELPEAQVTIIKGVMGHNEEDLEAALTSFCAKAQRGEHGGGGVLGRVAEFVVAQRGLTR